MKTKISEIRKSKAGPIMSRLWRTVVPISVRTKFWLQVERPEEYQGIHFCGKTYVRGADRAPLYDQLFQEPPKGKTLLDVGSNYGYYSIRAMLEGATRCTAIEYNENYARRMRAIVNDLGIRNLEVVNANVVDVELRDTYDIVLCLNMLHHLSTVERVEHVLDKFDKWARETLILSIAIPNDKSAIYEIDDRPTLIGMPLILLSPRYFVERYGQNDVQIEENRLYPGRVLVTIGKAHH